MTLRRTTRVLSLMLVLGLVALLPSEASAQRVLRYVPALDEMQGALQDLPYGITMLETDPEVWDAAIGYDLWYEGGVVYTAYISASITGSEGAAVAFFQDRLAFMLAGNEFTSDWSSYPEEVVGEGHDFRLIYWAEGYGRVSNYARLMRLGCAVVLVEVTGSPASDDEGYPDSDRGLVLTRVAGWSNRQMVRFPAICP